MSIRSSFKSSGVSYNSVCHPVGVWFLGNRYRGFRFAPSPSVICRPIGTQRMSRACAAVISIPKESILKAWKAGRLQAGVQRSGTPASMPSHIEVPKATTDEPQPRTKRRHRNNKWLHNKYLCLSVSIRGSFQSGVPWKYTSHCFWKTWFIFMEFILAFSGTPQ